MDIFKRYLRKHSMGLLLYEKNNNKTKLIDTNAVQQFPTAPLTFSLNKSTLLHFDTQLHRAFFFQKETIRVNEIIWCKTQYENTNNVNTIMFLMLSI